MATIQEISPAPWRLMLLPASFSGVPYHVEHQARSSGRRIVMHEYPKRNTPYAEDMGRHAIRYQVTGYLVGPNYNLIKLALVTALENVTGGLLVDPYLVMPLMAVCERYSVTEVRERGGYCTFDMMFAEAGNPGNSLAQADTGSAANASADASSGAAADSANGAADAASSGGFDESGFEGGFDTPAGGDAATGDGSGGGGW
jgi:prophage DNA circulation protein